MDFKNPEISSVGTVDLPNERYQMVTAAGSDVYGRSV